MTAQLATVTLRPAALDRLGETLETAALWERPGCDIPAVAEAAAFAGFTPEQRQLAWQGFQEAVIQRESLGTGERHWCEMYSEEDLPPAGDLTEAAIELACGEADDALAWLMTGLAR